MTSHAGEQQCPLTATQSLYSREKTPSLTVLHYRHMGSAEGSIRGGFPTLKTIISSTKFPGALEFRRSKSQYEIIDRIFELPATGIFPVKDEDLLKVPCSTTQEMTIWTTDTYVGEFGGLEFRVLWDRAHGKS